MSKQLPRRKFLQLSVNSTVALLSLPLINACKTSGSEAPPKPSAPQTKALMPADSNGCRLPEGFSSRIVARSSELVLPNSGFEWPGAPDGGACFPAHDGWIYVANSELGNGKGGASALRFDGSGNLIDAYPILQGSSRNCAGGATPRGTWLSCEENGDRGRVFECDPKGAVEAVDCPALGRFNHEAVAYDPLQHRLYLTEDRVEGKFYRYTPESLVGGYADLQRGTLECAEVISTAQYSYIKWHTVIDPLGEVEPTRYQCAASTSFNRGEGAAYSDGKIIFVTTGDNTVWSYNTRNGAIEVLYRGRSDAAELRGVDNVTAGPAGDILVAEDGGEMRIVAVDSNGQLASIAQLEGHQFSEVTGIAFDPSYSRLYFSSQRGLTGEAFNGITFEISGPF